MATISEMRRRVDKLNMTGLVVGAMEENPDELVDMNRKQMDDGTLKTGSPITPDYTPLTKFLKAQKGQPFDRVTLQDTGSFKSRMMLKIQGESFDIVSDDSKTGKLLSKYGENIFGLTDEHKAEAWNDLLQPSVVRNVSEQTGMTYG